MQKCEVCGNSGLIPLSSSILFDRYPFFKSRLLKQCKACGAKYHVCQCGFMLNRIHLSLDPLDIKSECPECNTKYPDIEEWFDNIMKISKNSKAN